MYVVRRAIKSKDVDSRVLLKSALFTLFSLACLWRAEASLSGLSQPSTAHSLLIYQSLPPSQLSQLQPGPCDCCLSHLTLHWLALMSLSTRKSRGPSLNRAEGDYVTACLWGWNIFFFKYICLIHTLFNIRRLWAML